MPFTSCCSDCCCSCCCTRADDGYYHPSKERELVSLVKLAYREGLQLRVRGSLHSYPTTIVLFQDPPGSQRSQLNVALDRYRAVHWIDEEEGLLEVEAGCILTEDEFAIGGPSDVAEGLCPQMDEKGWALPSLGGISAQTVAGYLLTPSAGGTVQFPIDESIVALRMIDGTGRVRTFETGTEEFNAARVSMGLMGVVSTVRIKGVPRYGVRGSQATTNIADCKVDLFGPGAPGRPSMEEWLLTTQYTRLNWWPEKGFDRVELWEAERIEIGKDFKVIPWEFFSSEVEEMLAGLVLAIIGNLADLSGLPPKLSKPIELGLPTFWSQVNGNIAQALIDTFGFNKTIADAFGIIIGWIVKVLVDGIFDFPPNQLVADVIEKNLSEILPLVLNLFVPLDSADRGGKPQPFQDIWWKALPLDQQVNYALLPVDFTELWMPISKTRELMNKLRDFFAGGGLERTGTFYVEIYGAAGSRSWLSPSSVWPGMTAPEPVVRFNVVRNIFDIRGPYNYYGMFFQLLKPLSYKAHWGKYIPEDPEYFRRLYPRWDEFLALRAEMDPDNIFLTRYWSDNLGIKLVHDASDGSGTGSDGTDEAARFRITPFGLFQTCWHPHVSEADEFHQKFHKHTGEATAIS